MRFQFLTLYLALASAVSAQHAFNYRDDWTPFEWFPDACHLDGLAFYAYTQTTPEQYAALGLRTLYELYNTKTHQYFYTIDDAERNALHPPGHKFYNFNDWYYGVGNYFVFPNEGPNRVPLWRSYNGNDHFYSLDKTEGPRAGYSVEGVAAWVYSSPIDGTKPIYRWRYG